jgi:serine/threonine protein kinase
LLVKTIAETIHFAHEHVVLHRDLKPSNVLIDENDRPHVSDFGLAKRLDADMDLTFSGQILGSPSYMSPEQAGSIEHSRVIRYDGADENIADGGCFALFESCLGRLQNNPPGSSTGSDSPCGDHRTR